MTSHLSPTARLRPFSGVSAMLRDYGATMPEPIVEAQALLREARLVSAEHRIGDPITYARQAVASGDLRKGIASAAKSRAADRDRAEIASHVFEAAAERVLSTVAAHADEIADAVFGSEVLARAFEDVARHAEHVPASTRRSPDLDRDGAALVANVAHLRAASEIFDRALVRLIASGILPDPARDGAAALLFARPDGADPESLRRALRGIRPGVPDVNVWTASAVAAPAARPYAEHGIRPRSSSGRTASPSSLRRRSGTSRPGSPRCTA